MPIDEQSFFNKVRANPFGGTLSQSQVDGLNAILNGFETRYPAGEIQPVREAFWLSEAWQQANLRYYPYYGRGYVQLTWKNNYGRESQPDRTGTDLVTNPDVALKPEIAAQVLFVGMEHGDFGGGGMALYFNGTTEDPVSARQLVNAMDHAQQIAALYANFKAALS